MAPRSSITKRWLLNSFGIIVVIMVAMVIGVSAAMHSFYYNSASQYIRTRAAAVSARPRADVLGGAWKAPRPMRAATLMPSCMSWYRILNTRTG